MPTHIDLLHPSELDEADVLAWRDLQAATPSFSNPLLGPAFARAVGSVRDDARVAIWRAEGRALGFLPFHQRPSGLGRPIGAPLSDLQGLVSAAGVPLRGSELLGAAGLKALKINGLIDPHGVLGEGPQGEGFSHRISLEGDAAQYLDRLRAHSRNGAKNFKRYSQRLSLEVGELKLIAPDRRRVSLERLLAWKSAQLRQTGLHDFLQVGWVQTLIHRLFDARQEGFEGLLLGLYAGRRLVAGQFGVRLGPHFHPWIAAMDPQMKPYSPGSLFQWLAIEAMPGLGLKTYELGSDGGHWKKTFSLEALPIRTGLASASNTAGLIAAAQERLYDWPSQRVQSLGRLRRRLDHIASVELTFAGRTRGVIDALASYDRRNAARRAA